MTSQAAPLTASDTYQQLSASLTGPQAAIPNTSFSVAAAGAIVGGSSTDVHSYALYEDAQWSYTSGHMVQVASGTLVASKGFNWGSSYSGTFSFSKPAGTYTYTLVMGYRSGAHSWYDLAVNLKVEVKAVSTPYAYGITGKSSATTSSLNLAGFTYVQLAPQQAGTYYGNIKVTYDQADKVECVSIEETPDGQGMWAWWTTATADPSKGSTGTIYKYSDGGGQWAAKWVAQGDGSGTPGSIDKGTGAAGSTGAVFLYTSGSTTVQGFAPLRLGFKLKTGVTAPVTVTFGVQSNALTSFDWHAASLGAPVTSKVTITPALEVAAVVDCKPDTLNLMSNGKWVKCYIELPTTKLGVMRIIPGSVRLNGVIKAVAWYDKVGDYDGDGEWDREVRFPRAAVAALLTPGSAVLTVTGKLLARSFSGADTVKVISK